MSNQELIENTPRRPRPVRIGQNLITSMVVMMATVICLIGFGFIARCLWELIRLGWRGLLIFVLCLPVLGCDMHLKFESGVGSTNKVAVTTNSSIQHH